MPTTAVQILSVRKSRRSPSVVAGGARSRRAGEAGPCCGGRRPTGRRARCRAGSAGPPRGRCPGEAESRRAGGTGRRRRRRARAGARPPRPRRGRSGARRRGGRGRDASRSGHHAAIHTTTADHHAATPARVEASGGGPAPRHHGERRAHGKREEPPARHSRVGERRGLGRVRAHPAHGDERPRREARAQRRGRRRRQPLILHDRAGVGQEGEAEQPERDEREGGAGCRDARRPCGAIAGRRQSRCAFQGYEDFSARRRAR